MFWLKEVTVFLESDTRSTTVRTPWILFSSLWLDFYCAGLFPMMWVRPWVRNIAKLRPIVSLSKLEMIIYAFVSSRLDYCNSLFTCLYNASLEWLQGVQNAAARILTKYPKYSHATPLLIHLHWLPVKFSVHFKIIIMTYRALHGVAPTYLSDLLLSYHPSRSLRSCDQGLVVVQHTRLKTKGDRAFVSVAPRLWNSLPLSLRSVDSVISLKSS